ncbi:Terpenoid synthases superfamily protein [Thalictrum thalictroides]|uniref:Terpenoid synthases superfamily protein n=1 Tax=Thalictrum thalictroides TaxID=46969 RepID=A0A7J6VF56_THATH|nr:Terpenoid synthases superfamily protein [Thalictrum thalictroides]
MVLQHPAALEQPCHTVCNKYKVMITTTTSQALSSVVFDHKISKSWLKRSVEARTNDGRREDDEIPEKFEELNYHATRNHQNSYIPAELASKHGLLVEQGGRKQIQIDSHEGLTEAVFKMGSVANVHLQKARELARTVLAEAVPVRLPAVPVQVVLLDSLRRVQVDVFRSEIDKRDTHFANLVSVEVEVACIEKEILNLFRLYLFPVLM